MARNWLTSLLFTIIMLEVDHLFYRNKQSDGFLLKIVENLKKKLPIRRGASIYNKSIIYF